MGRYGNEVLQLYNIPTANEILDLETWLENEEEEDVERELEITDV
jgi:hypothetical protein